MIEYLPFTYPSRARTIVLARGTKSSRAYARNKTYILLTRRFFSFRVVHVSWELDLPRDGPPPRSISRRRNRVGACVRIGKRISRRSVAATTLLVTRRVHVYSFTLYLYFNLFVPIVARVISAGSRSGWQTSWASSRRLFEAALKSIREWTI